MLPQQLQAALLSTRSKITPQGRPRGRAWWTSWASSKQLSWKLSAASSQTSWHCSRSGPR